jgi:alpha-L-arabinofuranosidase
MIAVMTKRRIYRLTRPLVLAALILCAVEADAQNSLSIYSDELNNGWENGSYNGTYNFVNPSPVHSGSDSISATVTSAYGGIALNHTAMTNSAYTSISFWLNGGASGGQQLQMYGTLNYGAQGARYLVSAPPVNAWQQYIVPLSALGVANATNFTGFAIQDSAGTSEPIFYLDDIQLMSSAVPALVHVGVNAAQPLRAADARWFGLNTAIWDGYFDTTYTSNALKELGTQILRGPGGSLSDDYHWATATRNNGYQYDPTKFSNFIHVATNAGVQAIITVNYGTGTSNEAAAWVAYANAATTNSLGLGTDQYGTNWFNSGYWASLRAAAPQGGNDGENFLRLSRTEPFGFKYWEVGNENYGTWEYDSNTYPNDPYTYGVRAAGYITLMKQVDPTIKIGVPVVTGEDSNDNGYSSHPAYNARTASYHNGWTPVVLATLKSLGVTPDFLVYHVYPEYGTDSDAGLLQASGNWAGDAANLRQQISDYIGTTGTDIELLCTENNADADNGGKQSTSIVNGLYLADSLAQLMKTEFNSFIWWDLRNGQNTTDADFDSSLYGWRTYGDLGIIGNANTRYPTFFTFKLMQYFARPGDSVLNATSDYNQLSAYAARKADGAFALLVINKNGVTNLNAQITLTNFSPWSTATARSFGIAQDEATRTNSIIPGAQDIATNSFAVAGTNFMVSFPPYSLTLLTFSPAGPVLQTIGASGGQYIFQLQGQPGVPYVIQNSTDMASWISVATNTLSSSTMNVTNTISSSLPVQFWRALWLP